MPVKSHVKFPSPQNWSSTAKEHVAPTACLAQLIQPSEGPAISNWFKKISFHPDHRQTHSPISDDIILAAKVKI